MSKGYKYGVFTLDMNSDYGVLVYKDKALAEKCYKALFEGTMDIKKRYKNGLTRSDAVAAYDYVLHNVFDVAEQYIDFVDISCISEKELWGKSRKVFELDGVKIILVNSEAIVIEL